MRVATAAGIIQIVLAALTVGEICQERGLGQCLNKVAAISIPVTGDLQRQLADTTIFTRRHITITTTTNHQIIFTGTLEETVAKEPDPAGDHLTQCTVMEYRAITPPELRVRSSFT
jgi:hypothetical protein